MTMLISAPRSQLLIVDVQERLAPAMDGVQIMIANVERLARAARILDVPLTLSEQYPKGLGPTLASVREACAESSVVMHKMEFSCGRDSALCDRILALDRPQAIICGLEAHVCVLQTAIDLTARGFACFVIADAIASRRAESKQVALRRLERLGVALVTTEMVIFEWLERAGSTQFKAIAPFVK